MSVYMLRNLKSLFTKQRMLAMLLLLNVVVSCLVICFSYGLYQNYNVKVQKGEEDDMDVLDIRIKTEDSYIFEPTHMPTADIDPQKFVEFAKMLSPETASNISTISVSYMIETPLCYVNDGDHPDEAWMDGAPDFSIYSDDTDTAYAEIHFLFRPVGDKVVDAYIREDTFDDDCYNNGDKVVVLESVFYDPKGSASDTYRSDYSYTCRLIPEDVRSVIIGGERYDVVNVLNMDEGEINVYSLISIPITAVPEGAALELDKVMGVDYGIEDELYCFSIRFNKPVTNEQRSDVADCLQNVFGDKLFLPPIKLTEVTEIYYYKTIMLVSVVIAVLAAINMAILYRYILEKRSSELAIFRICGCSKANAINCYLIECLIINAPLFALTQLIYHKLIMPRLTGFLPHMAGAYSFKLYAAIFGIYVATSFFVMMIMINATVKRHSLVDLKNSTKATGKFGIMKVFEVIQLAIVLSMLVLIVSAIASRYSLFSNFKQYIERRGYLVQSTDAGMYTDKFEEIIGDAEYIMNQSGSMAIGEFGTSSYTNFGGILYSDEFIEAYKPLMEEGVWLSDVDETYESSGYIPTVITSCDGRYKVGDVIEQDYELDWVDDKPTRIVHAKYKIVGILADKVRVASYLIGGSGEPLPDRSYEDIYAVFSDSFEKEDYLLRRISDEHACFGSNGIIWGIQFVFCDDMTDEEYEEFGEMLSKKDGFAVVPLSEVYDNSFERIYEEMYTLFPIAACIFILTIISTVSISAIYTKRQLRNYAIFYICGARWRTCALKSLKNGAITCAVASVLSAVILIIGKATFLKHTVISFSIWHFAACAGVMVLYLALSMIMPLSIIGSSEPREVLKEE